jgi:hypothetical protein
MYLRLSGVTLDIIFCGLGEFMRSLSHKKFKLYSNNTMLENIESGNMQCNYYSNDSTGPKCHAGPQDYKPSRDEQKKDCVNDRFRECQRYIASIEINKSKQPLLKLGD